VRVFLALAAAMSVQSLAAGHAAEPAGEGAIDAVYAAHNAQSIPDLDAADGQNAYVNEAFLVLTSAAQTGDLLGGKSARCLGYGSYDAAGAFHEEGRCTFVDADGDRIYETYVITSDLNPGRGQITGGTGKYNGIRGEYVLTYEPMATFAGGHSTGRGTKKGSYTIGR
jgi:hypothetical protein